jgi:hypothetical protein
VFGWVVEWVAVVFWVVAEFDGLLSPCSSPWLKKLDQVLVNVKWNCEFTSSEKCYLPFGISDHSPMLVKVASLWKRKLQFKFFDFWAYIIILFLPLIFET